MATGTINIGGVPHDYIWDTDNICIKDSCTVSKRWFDTALLLLGCRHPGLMVWQRTTKSLKREWATHNLLYALGLWRRRTKDVDLNYPNKWEWLYNITGAVALLFIK